MNPVYTVGDQLMEAVTCHDKSVSKKEARNRAIEMLNMVGINNAEKRIDQYPHEFSGGMRQRAMIAMGLICHPKLLIADEPTTALDVTTQAQILELMKELQAKNNMSIIFITHNLGVVAEICDRVSVMYAGHIVEQGEVNDIFYHPKHPYTCLLYTSCKCGEFMYQQFSALLPLITGEFQTVHQIRLKGNPGDKVRLRNSGEKVLNP